MLAIIATSRRLPVSALHFVDQDFSPSYTVAYGVAHSRQRERDRETSLIAGSASPLTDKHHEQFADQTTLAVASRARGSSPRDRKREPARPARRNACHYAAPPRARIGAHPFSYHHRLQRGAARAHHRRPLDGGRLSGRA